MSLRDIFRSLHLIVRVPHTAHFPLGLIFPLNLSLGICPPEQNIYLKFPPASEARAVVAPAAWPNASRPCFAPASPAPRAVTVRAAALVTHSHSWIVSERFGKTQKGKAARIYLRGKGGSSRPLDQPESETMQLGPVAEQEATLSGAVDSTSGLVLLYFSVPSLPSTL